MYIYEHCLGYLYTSDIYYEKHQLYRSRYFDYDTLIGEANTKEDAYKLLMDYKAINPGHTLGYILNFIEENFKDEQAQKESILKSISPEDHTNRYNLLESIKKAVSEECYITKEPSVESNINELIKEKCHSVGNLVITEMCRYFGETLPPAISERINKRIEEFCNDKNN